MNLLLFFGRRGGYAVRMCPCGFLVLALSLLFATPVGAASLYVPVSACRAKLQRQADGEIRLIAAEHSQVSSPGDPQLPFKELQVILPPGTDTDSIRLSLEPDTATESIPLFAIAPAPPMISRAGEETLTYWGENKTIVGGRNMQVYGRNAWYPEGHVELVSTGKMRKWLIATVRYYPFLYNPATKRLKISNARRIRLEIEPSAGIQAQGSGRDAVLDDLVSELAVNYQQAKNWYGGSIQAAAAAQQYDYVIITTNEIRQKSRTLQEFVDHKRDTCGFSPLIVTEDQWNGYTQYERTQDRIRGFLQDNYKVLGIKYVLLIGNPTAGIPMPLLYPGELAGATKDKDVPTDYYYADLTGDWEYLLSGPGTLKTAKKHYDLIPEVFVGRIPFYGNSENLDSILRKTIDYETGVYSGEWIKTVLLSMKPSDDATPGYPLGEEIRNNFALKAGYETYRIYDSKFAADSVNEEYKRLQIKPDASPCSLLNVVDGWKRKAGFHFWWTHGSATSAAGIFNADSCRELDERFPSFTFQVSCYNGKPESSDNLGYSLLRRGAVATVSASRVSWYQPGEKKFTDSWTNAGMGYLYAGNLLVDNLPCGDAFYKMQLATPDGNLMNKLVFNLYGDPSVASAAGAGLQMIHQPLQNTENTGADYPVAVSVAAGAAVSPAAFSVYWKTDSDPQYRQLAMAEERPREYTASILAQGLMTKVSYYIEARDQKGRVSRLPAEAPEKAYSFLVVHDSFAPQIQHESSAVWFAQEQGQALVKAQISDASGIAGARVEYRIDDGSDLVQAMEDKGADVFEALLPAPQAGQKTLSYRIVAVDAAQRSNSAVFPNPRDYLQLSIDTKAPSHLSAELLDGGRIKLTWQDNYTRESGYKIERSTDGVTFTQYAKTYANVTSWTDRVVSAGGTYYYRVYAYSYQNPSLYSNVVSVTVPSLPLPPAMIVAQPLSSSQIGVFWMRDTRDSVIGDYAVLERSFTGTSFVKVAEVKWPGGYYLDTRLKPATPYYYRVKLHNASGYSPFSAVVKALTHAQIDTTPPLNVSATAAVTGNRLLQVILKAEDPESGVSGFEYRIVADNQPVTEYRFLEASYGSANVVTAFPAVAGTEYCFEARAQNTAGLWSEAVRSNTVRVQDPVTVTTPVVWTDLVGVTTSGSTIVKSAADAVWGNGGAASTQKIDGDGGVEFRSIADVAKNVAMCGLSAVNVNASYETIDYALYLRFGEIQVYEKGVSRGSFGSFGVGDTFAVERSGATVRYKRNNSVFYESAVPSSGQLLADAALYSNPGGIVLAKIKTVQ